MTRAASLLSALLLLGAPLARVCVTAESNSTNDTTVYNTSDLVHNIRRQLMADNYDYMSTETEEPFPMKHELDNADTTTADPETFATLPDYETTDILAEHVNDIFMPRTVGSSANDQIEEYTSLDADDHGIAKNDLLYYIDDNRLKNDGGAVSKGLEENESFETTPKVKYKVLKMKQPETAGDGRRAGQAGPMYRRFLQEENGDGVVIINLGHEPFPEFRLPSARRQYMSAEDPVELEIAPVSELSEEMVQKFGDV